MDLGTLLGMLPSPAKNVGGGVWRAVCPAHADKSPSLVLREDQGKLLVHCFSGCSLSEIAGSLGLKVSDFFSKHRSLPPPLRKNNPDLFERWKKSHAQLLKLSNQMEAAAKFFREHVDEAMDLVVRERQQAAEYSADVTREKETESPPYCWWTCSMACFPKLEHEEGCGGCRKHATCPHRLCEEHCNKTCWTYGPAKIQAGSAVKRKRITIHERLGFSARRA